MRNIQTADAIFLAQIPEHLAQARRLIRIFGTGLVVESASVSDRLLPHANTPRQVTHSDPSVVSQTAAYRTDEDGILLSELDAAFERWCIEAVAPQTARQTLEAVAVTFGHILVERHQFRWCLESNAQTRAVAETSIGMASTVKTSNIPSSTMEQTIPSNMVAAHLLHLSAGDFLLSPWLIVWRRVYQLLPSRSTAAEKSTAVDSLLATYRAIRQHLHRHM
ncbi:MAG: hypothetical protein PHE53_04755 [Thermoguttaceae bacterium]|nr:hypothetical protein [Thermoguttaceae bacterium]